MSDPNSALTAGVAETAADFGEGDVGLFAHWQTQEKIAEKQERTWIRRSRRIIKRYRDERPDMASTGRDQKKFNLLWSNVETLTPVLYGRTPKADVERRFKDNDPVSRLAATLLERSLNYAIDAYDFDGVMKACVKDRLLPGRGVARVIYVPHYGDEIPLGDASEEAGEAGSPASAVVANEGDRGDAPLPAREVVWEEAKAAYVFWEDYREGPARVWAEVPWVRYRSYLTRDELINRFGKKKGDKVTLDFSAKGDDKERAQNDETPDAYKKAIVHEYWDKSKLETVWLAPGTADLILDRKPDPLKLNGFFPNPDPLLATTTTDKRIPVPDYIQYQDQAITIDDLTQRINKLTRALQAKGIYAGEEKDSLQRLMDAESDAIFVPVENFGMFAAKGGLGKVIEWMPIEQIAQTLIQLYDARDKEVQVVYQITGISDILRGETSPLETMGAQQLKSNFATRRITPKQKDVAEFARGLIRLKADIIATHFSNKTISMITGFPQVQPVPNAPPQPVAPAMPAVAVGTGAPGPGGGPPAPGALPGQPPQQPPNPAMQQYQQQMAQYQEAMQKIAAITAENAKLQQEFDQAVERLRQDAMHDFRIDIEADSTVAPDEQADKQNRVEFLQQMIPLLEQVLPIAQGNPAFAALAKEVSLFAMRGFHIARSLEETFEAAFDQIAQMPPNPNAFGGKGKSQADPKVEMAKVQQQAQADQSATAQKAQAEQEANAIKSQQVQGELAIKAQSAQARQQFEQGKLVMQAEKLQGEQQFRAMEMMHLQATEGRALE